METNEGDLGGDRGVISDDRPNIMGQGKKSMIKGAFVDNGAGNYTSV
jgi:hypothetical protein